jgi:hypothetical protein
VGRRRVRHGERLGEERGWDIEEGAGSAGSAVGTGITATRG